MAKHMNTKRNLTNQTKTPEDRSRPLFQGSMSDLLCRSEEENRNRVLRERNSLPNLTSIGLQGPLPKLGCKSDSHHGSSFHSLLLMTRLHIRRGP